jgi:hypothetical protein
MFSARGAGFSNAQKRSSIVSQEEEVETRSVLAEQYEVTSRKNFGSIQKRQSSVSKIRDVSIIRSVNLARDTVNRYQVQTVPGTGTVRARELCAAPACLAAVRTVP